MNALRTQVAQILEESARIRNENRRIQVLLSRTEKGQGEVVKRVGAIESTLPGLLDLGDGSTIDDSLITAAISNDAGAQTVDAEGGSVKVTQRPLNEDSTPAQSTMPAMPVAPIPQRRQMLTRDAQAGASQTDMATAFGLALGDGVTVRDAVLVWKDITQKAGPLLLGFEPLISDSPTDGSLRLIAGPVASYTQAEKICGRMIRVGIPCLPVPYAGDPLIE